MKGFIEVTKIDGTKTALNIDAIFAVVPHANTHCRIKLLMTGYNMFPYQYFDVTESYEDVLSLISGATK